MIGVYLQLAADTPSPTEGIYLAERQLNNEVSVSVPAKPGTQGMGFSGLCDQPHISTLFNLKVKPYDAFPSYHSVSLTWHQVIP